MTETSQSAPPPLLQVLGLTVGIRTVSGERAVLHDLSFSVSEGEVYSILGASGSGKSTLLRTIAGLALPHRGEVISHLARPGDKIGFLQQVGNALLPWRNLQDNVALGLELIGSSRAEARRQALAVLSLVGMADKRHLFPHQLSGGMIQRVVLARTLVTSPKLLLLDEPFSQLDILAREELCKVVKSYVRENGAAAVVVSHSIEETIALADTVVILSNESSTMVAQFGLAGSTGDEVIPLPKSSAFQRIHSTLINSFTKGA